MKKGERNAEALAAEEFAEHDGVARLLSSSFTFQEGRDTIDHHSVRIHPLAKSALRRGRVGRGAASSALCRALAVLTILILISVCLLGATFLSISVTSCSHPDAALRNRATPVLLQKALVARRLFGRVAQVFTPLREFIDYKTSMITD